MYVVREKDTRLQVSIQNVVSTALLQPGTGRELNLRTLALKARNAEFNPDRFAALILRLSEPKATALVFQSGKMVVTGTKSEKAARDATAKFAAMIKKIMASDKDASGRAAGASSSAGAFEVTDFTLRNIVASADVGFPIQLEHLAFEHHRFASYEPELFPGLIYRMQTPRIAILVFVSGKIVLTGAKFEENIMEAFTKIYPVLKGFQKARYTLPGGRLINNAPAAAAVSYTHLTLPTIA